MGIKTEFSKKWHNIPIGIILMLIVLVLIAGSTFAIFRVASLANNKSLSLQYNLCGQYDEDSKWHSGTDSEWHSLRNSNILVIKGNAGDTFNIEVWVFNTADNYLKVLTEITDPTGYLTISGYPMGNVPNSYKGETDPEWKGIIKIEISEDAPAGETYTVTFSFDVNNKGRNND